MGEAVLRIPDDAESRRVRTPQEDVPQTPAERERVRRTVRRVVAEERPVPPLSRRELEACADLAVGRAGIDRKYARYAAVLVSNEVWRPRLAAVPFERRLLLLPQCLRDPRTCPGTLDQYGLVCAGCGRCPIDGLKTEAESLGYAVLTAEGTAVVMALIRSGKIDGVVGVSCLDALERVYPYIEAAAVPAVAIPLLRDGCANTFVDLGWVREMVHMEGDGLARRVDLDALRADVGAWFTEAALEEVLGPSGGSTESIGRQWLAKGGKRWRPALTAYVYQALQDEPGAGLPADLRAVAVGVECFHKASLVHDDIEDHDAVRYGEATLHERYGVPMALNVGDYLLGEGYRLIAECGADAGRRALMLTAAARGHRSLAIGQGAELDWVRRPRCLSPREVLDIFRLKTAPAFEVALRLGAICAGAEKQVAGVLPAYSESLGIAYQIRDDLKDWRSEDGGDASAMRPSILLAIAQRRARGESKRLLDALARRETPGAGPEAVERVFSDLGAAGAAERLLAAYEDKAVRCLEPLTHHDLKAALRRVIFRIFSDGRPGDLSRESSSRDASGRAAGAESAA